MARTISISLPDGNERKYSSGVTAAEIAHDIAPSLGKRAISADLNGSHWDLQWQITSDAALKINTMADETPALELVRHDLAHIMARAVQELWPETKVTIGPVIENGWYYDFDREESFTPADLTLIEAQMKRIIALKDSVHTEVWERDRAIQYYRDRGEPYKVELIERIPEGEPVRMYWHGDWQDLCRGPHLANTGQVPGDAFKLREISGAYWRGDSRNQMLQRIYGVAFRKRDDLKKHLHMLEEAQKRDHRKIGTEMSLFHFQEEAPGWHSGIRGDGRSTSNSANTWRASKPRTAMSRLTRLSSWIARFGRRPATGKSSTSTCSWSTSTWSSTKRNESTR